ncbi:uncharacterized protein LOC109831439, partial [Asparagus officinalis]|uniref:uncharacterized protein LOC109831439 n=1 Tax=Asparagus officinalis TaxID=4686 RepID=UPI00098DE9F0
MHEFRLEEDDRSYKGTRGTSFVVCRVFKKNVVGNKNADERLAPLMEERRDEEDRDQTPTAEREGGHANDFEQGTTEAVHGTDLSTISCEASSLNLNPPSDGLLAPGFRFHPTDEELVSYYLKRKVAGLPLHVDAIGEIDLYKWDPWDLPPRSRLNLSMLSTEWFFFCTLDRKYNRSSHQNNRATAKGFWKSTGIDRSVRHRTSEKIIGMKKTLVFHTGRAPGGQRTNWVMHEYRLEDNEQNTKGSSFVVCRIFHKSGAGPRKPLALYGTEPFVELEETAQDLGPARKYLQVPDVNVDTVPSVVVADVVDKNCEHALKNSEQVTTARTYDIGSKVEIAYIRDKLPVAWYMATVIKVIDERVLLVEYENLKSEDDTLLSEIVSAQYIRPHPPPTAEARNFHLLDEVEAFYNGGWWPGVVAKVIADSRYNVKFMHWEEEIEFNHTELRLLYDWVDGRWIQASQDKPIESQDLGGGKSIGHTQSLHECNSAPTCGFPGSSTPSSGMRDEAPSMTNENENLARLTFESQQDIFQPCKKAKKGETSDNNTQLLDLRGNENSSAVKMGFDIRTPIVEEEPNIRTPMVEEEPNIRIKALVEKGCFSSPSKKNDVVSADSITMSGEINEDPPVSDKLSQELVSVHKPLSSNGEESHEGRSGKNEFLQMGQESGA